MRARLRARKRCGCFGGASRISARRSEMRSATPQLARRGAGPWGHDVDREARPIWPHGNGDTRHSKRIFARRGRASQLFICDVAGEKPLELPMTDVRIPPDDNARSDDLRTDLARVPLELLDCDHGRLRQWAGLALCLRQTGACLRFLPPQLVCGALVRRRRACSACLGLFRSGSVMASCGHLVNSGTWRRARCQQQCDQHSVHFVVSLEGREVTARFWVCTNGATRRKACCL